MKAVTALFAVCALALSGCPETGIGNTIEWQTSESWQRQKLYTLAVELRDTFSREGSAGLLRLRLHDDELDTLFTKEAAERIRHTNSGLAPTTDERRWIAFRSLASSPLVGFCARGVRTLRPGTPLGLRSEVVGVDRLLLVGTEDGKRWGAWIEGIVLTENGWRLMPNVTFARQVEAPRRNHTDIEYWECDVGVRDRGTEAAKGY